MPDFHFGDFKFNDIGYSALLTNKRSGSLKEYYMLAVRQLIKG